MLSLFHAYAAFAFAILLCRLRHVFQRRCFRYAAILPRRHFDAAAMFSRHAAFDFHADAALPPRFYAYYFFFASIVLPRA